MKLAIDLGGSSSRIGETEADISELMSTYYEISPTLPVKETIHDGLSEFILKKHPVATLTGKRYAIGEAATIYGGIERFTTNQTFKTLQPIVYAQIAYAIATYLLQHNIVEDNNVELGVCIPTSEFFDVQTDYPSILKGQCVGDYEVYFPLLKKSVTFSIMPNAIVQPEGVCAAAQFFGNKNFRKGVTCIVDMGCRSTDITILDKGRPLGRSAKSKAYGGMELESYIANSLERKNIFVNTQELRNALCSYYVEKADGLHDITDVVNEVLDEDSNENIIAEICKKLIERDEKATNNEVAQALSKTYIIKGMKHYDITADVVSAREELVPAIVKDITAALSLEHMNISDITNLLCVGRPFSGSNTDPNTLKVMLHKHVPNAALYACKSQKFANVRSVIKALHGRA